MAKLDSVGLVLRINAPDWYDRKDFVAWLSDENNLVATWHERGEKPNEFSDVFVTYDDGEGSDSNMPQDIWAQICQFAEEAHFSAGLVWISNLEE